MINLKQKLLILISKFLLNFKYKKFEFKILMFHNIEKKNFLRLEKILKELKKNYNFINPKNLNKINNNGNILLTFDDGFLSNYFFAKKVLNKLNIKGIFFIVTDLVDKKNKKEIISKIIDKKYLKNQKFLEKKHLNQLIKMGHSIGAHGKSHLRLSQINDYKKLREEIVTPKITIMKKFKFKTNFFAFPYGDIKSINKKSINIIFKEYRYLFSGIRGDNVCIKNSKKIFFRENIISNYPKSVIELFIKGFLDFRYFFDRKKILKYKKNYL